MATIDDLLSALALFAALGCGLIAGVFFAFSAFIMKALARLPPPEGVAAMQSINVAVINPVFMMAFIGTAAACVLVMLLSLWRWHDAGAVYSLAGGALYVVGCFMVTMIFNVPKNEALARVTPSDPDGPELWAKYLTGWTAWNHVRAAASLAATALLIVARCS